MDKDSIFYWIQWTVLCKITNIADTTKKKWLVKSINANTKQAVAAKKTINLLPQLYQRQNSPWSL